MSKASKPTSSTSSNGGGGGGKGKSRAPRAPRSRTPHSQHSQAGEMVTLVTYDDLFEHLQLGIPGGTGAVAGSANLANLTNHSTHLSNSTNHMAHAATIAGASGVSGLLPLPGTYGVPPMGQGLSVNNTPTTGAGGSATPVVPPVPSSASLIQLRQLLGQLRDTAVARRGRNGGGFSTAAVGGKAGGKGGGKGGEMGGKGKGGSMGDKGKGKAEDLLIQKAVKEEKKKLKKRKAESEQKRPLAVGAHQVVGQGPDRKKRALNPVIKRSPSSSRSPSPPHQPPAPLPFIALTDLDSNPALYQIPPVTASSTHADLLRAFSVSSFPSSDLSHLIPGTSPPDEDFSKSKPTNQVSITTFSSFLEPYFRPFNEEDLAFLRERGDRVTPFLIPKLGTHYEQAWREEDKNALGEDTTRGFGGARGAPGDITEEAVEREDVSCGPLLSRLLAAYLPENESPLASPTAVAAPAPAPATPRTFATTLPGATPVPISPTAPAAGYSIPTIKSDYQTLDERIRREMIYVGLLDPNTELDFDNRSDDEVSARLRMLQKQLREQVEVNTKRKERIGEILREQMAYQEYVTILEDLDKQVEQSFTKRSRSLNKPKKKKTSSAAKSTFLPNAPPPPRVPVDIGEQARVLMERRKRWIETIGPVFDGEIMAMPGKGRGVFEGLGLEGMEKEGGKGVNRER